SMKYILYSLIFICMYFSPELRAQSQVKTYYDSAATIIKEEYFILNQDSTMVDGVYTMFHENVKTAVEGQYTRGKKDGLFKEYYPDGTLKRVMHYNKGLRDGEVVVYNPNGKLAQKGVFQNDTLTGTLAVYYPEGDIKSRTDFEAGKPDG